MRETSFGLSLLLSLALGCGDDSPPGPFVDAGTDGSTDTGAVPGDGSPGDAATDAGPTVPPVKLIADPVTDCPGAFATTAPVMGWNLAFMSAGQSRAFYFLPPPPSFTGPRPLFFAFNGTGEDGQVFADRAMLQEFAARGFIVVAPSSNANGTVWPPWDDMRMAGTTGPNPDVTLFDELIACVAGHFEVDANRLYAGGHSAGGIMTNAILKRRSDVLAGGIVASGIIDLTDPVPVVDPLDAMFVIVTWGGGNDSYSDPMLPSFSFVEQASLASQFYEAQPNVGQANCHIAAPGGGHVWLPINDWFIDRLLEHPKGVPGNVPADLVIPDPGTTGISCTKAAYVYVPPVVSVCPTSTTPGCQGACQYIADCMVENSSVAPVVAAQITMLGFSGVDNADCTGCVTKCETDATMPADAAVLTCLETAMGAGMCSGGISGFQPYADAINMCCMGRTDSPYCVEVCRIIKTNALASGFFTSCAAL